MTIDWWRDLVIIVFCVVALGLLVFMGAMLFLLYHRVKLTLDAVLFAAETVREISDYVKSEISGARPFLQAVTLIQGIREGAEIVLKLFRKR